MHDGQYHVLMNYDSAFIKDVSDVSYAVRDLWQCLLTQVLIT